MKSSTKASTKTLAGCLSGRALLRRSLPRFVGMNPRLCGLLLLSEEICLMVLKRHRGKGGTALRAQRRHMELARVSHGACAQLEGGRDFAWEVPYDLRYLKSCDAKGNIMSSATSCGRKIYDMVVEGCFYKPSGAHGKKWRVLTSSPQLAALQRCCCPGHKEHLLPDGHVKYAAGGGDPGWHPLGVQASGPRCV